MAHLSTQRGFDKIDKFVLLFSVRIISERCVVTRQTKLSLVELVFAYGKYVCEFSSLIDNIFMIKQIVFLLQTFGDIKFTFLWCVLYSMIQLFIVLYTKDIR